MKRNIVIASITLLLSSSTLISASPENSKSIILIKDGDIVITSEDARFLLEDMNPRQRQKVLLNKEKLKNLLLDLVILNKRSTEARKQELDQNKLVKWKIRKITNQLLIKELANHYKKSLSLPQNIEELAKEYYDSHQDEFTNKEQVKVSHILLKTDSTNKDKQHQKAQKILAQIKSGESFSELAKLHSDDAASAQAGGILSYFQHGRMVKPFEDAAFKLANKNDISNIVESRYGYHIIKLIDHNASNIIPFKEVKDKLIKKEIKTYTNKKLKNYMNSLGVTGKTTIYKPALDNFFTNQKGNYQSD